MLSDGIHLIELAPVDVVEGEPIPESAEGKAILFVNIMAPRVRVHIKTPKPNEILDSNSDLWLDVDIVQEHLDGESAATSVDTLRNWRVGQDGYVRVQINNNTEDRTFAHAGPYKVSNLETGVHTLEVIIVDMNFMPMTQRDGQAAVSVARFAYMVTEKEKERRRKIEALQGEALKQALSGNGELAGNMIDVVKRQRGEDAPGGRDSQGVPVVDMESVSPAPLLAHGTTENEVRWSSENGPPQDDKLSN